MAQKSRMGKSCFSRVYIFVIYVLLLKKSLLLSSTEAISRHKRFIIVSPHENIQIGFLIAFPVSIMLPTLAPVNGQIGRSLELIFANEEEEIPDDLIIDPGYNRQVDKLLSFFTIMRIETMSCQERLICELTENPELYSPLSELLLRELRTNHGPLTQSSNSLMWRYIMAARLGMTIVGTQECQKAYPLCPLPAYKLLNMPVIKVWQYIASKTNLKLV